MNMYILIYIFIIDLSKVYAAFIQCDRFQQPYGPGRDWTGSEDRWMKINNFWVKKYLELTKSGLTGNYNMLRKQKIHVLHVVAQDNMIPICSSDTNLE